MPRKQNGFGNFKVSSVKSVDKSLRPGKVAAPGIYPSNRRFGSSVTRTVIQHYDIESSWAKWRKGLEFFYNAYWYTLYKKDANGDVVLDGNGNKETVLIDSKLYQGTGYEIDVKFTGWRFSSQSTDTNNHYVVKRTNTQTPNLGTISQVYNNSSATYTVGSNPTRTISGASNYSHKEIWIKSTNSSDLVLYSIGERIRDSSTEATLKNVLNDQLHPAIYLGKTNPTNKPTVKVTVPLSTVLATDFIVTNNGDVQSLIGQIGSLGAYAQESTITNETFTDHNYDFDISLDITKTNQTFQILENPSNLPPAVLDISSMAKLYDTSVASFDFNPTYKFTKEYYQRFFGDQYLTAGVVEGECNKYSYSIMPFVINSVLVVGSNLEITSIPFEANIKLFSDTADRYFIFTDHSFTIKSLDTYNGVDYHAPGDPANPNPWYRLDTDIDPWMDEVFTSGQNLTIADVYCCSCPNFTHAIIRVPEQTANDGKKINNRQYRYPLPTAMSKIDFQNEGLGEVAGIVQSWETFKQRTGFKMCKHTIAVMFNDNLKIKEPNSYPSLETRLKFEATLEKDMEENWSQRDNSFKRTGLTNMELVYTLAESLNLDEVETASVLLETKF